ncbi:hypothetical protein P170DRAFT_442390 [Aspergillus steynii IBT 23096]|uniref:Uncharacterized protein n=1 Tax=Aspergillus steynii IBT 23096 TaxID=1392250 RepID=A0A2I2GN38_9EURO|nr:uncharacterized protein P170DRAFT_442390 [Aspergillus steynii IBT 23096]PLB54269.1 hypothetical protein P170DRAFT_442390 [Aspergillus steynii IBT 23096]
MTSPVYNAADLTSVLQTLSALSNPAAPPPDHADSDAYEPTDALPPSPIVSPQPRPPESESNRSNPETTSQPRSRTSGNPAGSIEDTSSISTWPAALRHVMRAVSQNEDLQRRIRWLIQRQHDHEKQWWQGRDALLKKQRARVDKKKELDEVLRSVGAPVDNTKQISTAEEDEAELKRYDSKVYRASRQMAEAMAAELRGLQIPFFSIKPGLVDSSSETNSHPLSGEILTREELSGLQRRILELLQDLCKE